MPSQARNAACDLGYAELCPPWTHAFPELVSLSDMLPFAAFSFVKMMENIQSIEIQANVSCATGLRDAPVPDNLRMEWIDGWLNFCRFKCNELSLDRAIDRIDQIRGEYQHPITWDRVKVHVEFLRKDIDSELRFRRFAFIPIDKATVLIRVVSDWQPIWNGFPSVESDARQSTEAYALGLDTACIFHMMMVLEQGLKALAAEVGVRYARRNWATVIEDIETAITKASAASGKTPSGKKPPSPRVAARRRADITLFSAAAKEFTFFREAWRNHTAHGRASYDEHEALRVLIHVREFMARLASRLRERRK